MEPSELRQFEQEYLDSISAAVAASGAARAAVAKRDAITFMEVAKKEEDAYHLMRTARLDYQAALYKHLYLDNKDDLS